MILALIAFIGYQLFHVPGSRKFYDRGLEYYSKADYKRAGTEFLKAISEAREDGSPEARELLFDAYFLTGEIFDLRLNRHKRAVETYEEALRSSPPGEKIIEFNTRIADIAKEKLNDPRKALAIYRYLLERWPRHPRAGLFHLRLLEAYIALNEVEQAASEGKVFLQRNAKDPYAAAIRFLVADSLAFQEKWAEAKQNYLMTEREYPDSYHARLARFELGNCLLNEKRYADAAKAFEEAIADYPNPKVVRLRIREARKRLLNESDEEPLPEWARKKTGWRSYKAPPVIEPFPEDRRFVPKVTEDAEDKPKEEKEKPVVDTVGTEEKAPPTPSRPGLNKPENKKETSPKKSPLIAPVKAAPVETPRENSPQDKP